jgi:hypothetical protein
LVASFQGAHLNFPDVEILRRNNGRIESSRVNDAAGGAEDPQYARLLNDNGNYLIEIGKVREEGSGRQYKYMDDRLVEVKSNPVDTGIGNDFAIRVNNKYIALRQWDHEVNLGQILGNPISENVKVLGEGADTHQGTHIKTLKYDGLEVLLFSPEDNGKEFWVMSMAVTDGSYLTSKGIGLVNTVEEIKQAYSDVTMVQDGRTDPNNCAYEIRDDQNYNYLQFEVAGGKGKSIKMFHMID